MAQQAEIEQTKTALDLALELGLRSETVVQSLQKLGLEADNASVSIDPDMEEMVVEQMVADGVAPSSLSKGKGRRQRSDDPLVDDELLTEALGASESGFSESQIPRQLLVESRFAEKPSLFQRLFKKKKDLAKTLKKSETSEEDLKSYFPSSSDAPSPSQKSSFMDYHEESPEADREDTETSDEVKEEIGEEDLEELGIDESLMEELEGVEIDEEELGELDDEDLQGLEDISEDIEEEMPEEEEVEPEEESESPEEADEEFEDEGEEGEEEEGEEGEGEEGETGGEEEEEEELEPGFLERIISRIHLSPTEMWTLMGGSAATMLALLAATVYWWLNVSPEAVNSLYEEAIGYYDTASELESDPEETFQKEMNTWQKAADTFEEFINKYPDSHLVLDAYRNMCDCYYRIATGYDKKGMREESEEPYRKMALFYEHFLDYLDDLATRMLDSDDPKNNYLAYPKVDLQRTAMLRIALAQRKLRRYDAAIEKLEDFVRRFRGNQKDVLNAMVDIGKTYQEWADINSEQKTNLLNKAIDAYKKALKMVPEGGNADEFRMKYNAGLGNIEYQLYEQSKDQGIREEATPHLLEAIAYYERADKAARNADSVPIMEKQKLFKQLGDLYLIRGREAGLKWREFEETARPFPQVIRYKNDLLEAAEREKENAQKFLGEATELYDEILEEGLVNSEMFQEIQYNKAEANFILKNYSQAIAAGEELLQRQANINDDMKAKILYLMGDAAWEQAKNTNDYSKVKQYYRDALELNPFYPSEEKGEISHLAEIRLTNAYFMLDKKYEDAIKRFEKIVDRFPENDYTYLTRYYYGKALDECAAEKNLQAEKIEEQLSQLRGSPKSSQASQLRKEAKNLYLEAVTQYDLAIRSRDSSRYIDTKNKKFLIEMVFKQGHSAYKAGKYIDARNYLQEALAQYRDNDYAQKFVPPAIERLGDINVRLYVLDKAIDHYQDYLNSGYVDENAEVTMKLADAYLKSLNFDKARDWYEKIIKDHPPMTSRAIQRKKRQSVPITLGPGFEALKKLADSYYRQGAGIYENVNKREQILRQALEKYNNLVQRYPDALTTQQMPDFMNAQRMIGNIQYELGDYQQAADNYKSFLTNFPKYKRRGRIYYKIGKAYMQTEPPQYDKAFQSLKNVTMETLDTPVQYADTLILLGSAYELKAKEYQQKGEDQLYESYLERAMQAYERVNITNVKTKWDQAQNAIRRIDGILTSRKELATADNI